MSKFVSVNPTVCTGCRECEVVCSLYHVGECNPARSAIRVTRRERDGLVDVLPLVCQQCKPGYCIEACPCDALSRSGEQHILSVDQATCTGCGECMDACPAGCIFMDRVDNIALGCDLCGGDPQCIVFCHSHCLTIADGSDREKEDRLPQLANHLHRINQPTDPAGKGEL